MNTCCQSSCARYFLPAFCAVAALLLTLTPSSFGQASETDITNRDSDGQTALHKYTVYDWGSLEDVKILVARGADVNAVDNDGYTPLHMAAMSGYADKARFLLEKGARLKAFTKYGAAPLHLAAERRRFDPVLLGLLVGPANDSQVNLRDGEGRTPLWRAADADNADSVKWLLDHGADPNMANARGEQPLDRVLLLGYMKVARTLCENGASPNAITEDSMTVLIAVIDRGKPGAIDFLLSLKFDPNFKCKGDRTALHMAATKANQVAAKALLAAGATINAADENGRTPLDYVDESRDAPFAAWFKAQGAQPGIVKPKPVASADDEEEKAKPPLFRAVDLVNMAALKSAIAAGPTLLNQVDEYRQTPLMKAVEIGWIAGAEELLAAGADLKLKTGSGRGLVYIAAEAGKLPVLKWTVSKGLSVEEPDSGGTTPLIRAAGRNLDCVQFLLDQGANLNAHGKQGDSALSQAISRDKLDVFKFLIAKGADIGGVDSNNATLLLLSARKRSPEFARILLGKGADLNAKDKRGLTPLHRAADTRSAIETLKLLLEKGADRSAKDKDGKTPLDCATKVKNEAAIKLLQ
jgi:ankyrin repeat protein